MRCVVVTPPLRGSLRLRTGTLFAFTQQTPRIILLIHEKQSSEKCASHTFTVHLIQDTTTSVLPAEMHTVSPIIVCSSQPLKAPDAVSLYSRALSCR